jgi:nitroreductase
MQNALWGTIAQASWSFMLAARTRGLGSVWTCFHLFFEEEAAKLLGIPYEEVMQAALIPVAYTKGAAFQPAPRDPLETMVRWERW